MQPGENRESQGEVVKENQLILKCSGPKSGPRPADKQTLAAVTLCEQKQQKKREGDYEHQPRTQSITGRIEHNRAPLSSDLWTRAAAAQSMRPGVQRGSLVGRGEMGERYRDERGRQGRGKKGKSAGGMRREGSGQEERDTEKGKAGKDITETTASAGYRRVVLRPSMLKAFWIGSVWGGVT